MPNFTLIVPVFSQPNFLAVTLRGLIRNSFYKNRIIVVWSDPAHQGQSLMSDFAVTPSGERYHKYSSVQDYIAQKGDWCRDNNIEFVDVTDKCDAFMREYKAGKIWKGSSVTPAPGLWQGGQDVAFKDNLGVEMTYTDYVMPNWDCDFYPSPNWDKIMVDLASQTQRLRSIFVPVQIQPRELDPFPNWKSMWKECRYINCSAYTIPIPLGQANNMTDEELESFYGKWNSPSVHSERPGVREYLHHFPVLYRTNELQNIIGPYNYQGAGYDLEIDNRCGELGFVKFTPFNAWCIHKAWIKLRPEDL